MDDSVAQSGYLFRVNDRGAGIITYVILRGSGVLSFYNSHKDVAKGGVTAGYLILISGTAVETDSLCATSSGTPSKGSSQSLRFNFTVKTHLDSVTFCAKTKVEMDKWIATIQQAVQQSSLSSYIFVKKAATLFPVFFSRCSRKFFILNGSQLRQFNDHNSISVPEQSMTLDENVVVEKINDVKKKVKLTNTREKWTLCLQFDRRKGRHEEYTLWKENFLFLLLKGKEQMKKTLCRINRSFDSNLKIDHFMKLRSSSGDFKGVIVILTDDKELLIFSDKMTAAQPDASLIIERIELSRDMFALPTTLAEHSFQMVTSQKIFHLCCAEQSSVTQWVAALRKVIALARINLSDPLLLQAMDRASKDEFYEVHISNSSRSLGIQFERCRESVVVKSSRFESTGVHEGSILHAINGEACYNLSYETAILKLVDWKPPLSLKFRKCPEISGYLAKRCRVAKGGAAGMMWRLKYVSIAKGRLCVQDKADSSKISSMSLIGTSLSLPGATQTGRFYCFQVNYGTDTLMLQASSTEEMNEWTATIYHAQALANGGYHICCSDEIQSMRERGQACFIYSNSNNSSPADNMPGTPPAANSAAPPHSSSSPTGKLSLLNEYSAEERGKAPEEDTGVAALVMVAAAQADALDIFEAQMEEEEGRRDVQGVLAGSVADRAEDPPSSGSIKEAASKTVAAEEEQVVQGGDAHGLMHASVDTTHRAAVPDSPVSPARLPLSPRRSSPLQSVKVNSSSSNTPSTHGWALPPPPSLHSSSSLPLSATDASDSDIRGLFHAFAHSSTVDGSASAAKAAYMNPMNMSALLRVVSGDRGNLFKEMVTFNSFSSNKNGLIDEDDFVNGWLKEATGDCRVLRRLKYIAENIVTSNNNNDNSSGQSYENIENIVLYMS